MWNLKNRTNKKQNKIKLTDTVTKLVVEEGMGVSRWAKWVKGVRGTNFQV